MPLYDLRCSACAGIFERLLPVVKLHTEITCPYCAAQVAATPLPSGGVRVNLVQKWKPQSDLEALGGKRMSGPGAVSGARRSNVLHVCKGSDCSLCGT